MRVCRDNAPEATGATALVNQAAQGFLNHENEFAKLGRTNFQVLSHWEKFIQESTGFVSHSGCGGECHP